MDAAVPRPLAQAGPAFVAPGGSAAAPPQRQVLRGALQAVAPGHAHAGLDTGLPKSLLAAALVCGAGLARRGGSGLRSGQRAAAFATRTAAKAVASKEAKPAVAFVIGGPGSGKGTQCELIAKELGYTHLSAGDLLRAERKREGSQLGELIESTIKAGKTVPSEVIADLLEQAMREAGWSDAKFVIDGYPRSKAQLEGWEKSLSKKVNFLFCLSLEVGREEMRKRLLGRAETSGRSDDNAETIEKRFVTFQEETDPLLDYFGSRDLLQKVNGERGPDAVWNDVKGLFQDAEGAEPTKGGAAPKSGGGGDDLRSLLLNGK